jgi:hypothetical protein
MEVVMTIPKNTNRAKKAIANATNIRCFSLSNNFTGKPLAERPLVMGTDGESAEVTRAELLSRELSDFRAKLTASESGTYRIHVHSNLWYEFEAA